MHQEQFRWLRVALMSVLAGSVLWFVLKTIHWPLTGDASLMHYVTLLMDQGRAPYKDIGDMNLPMSYLPAWTVSHLFGVGDLPWRSCDLTLLLAAGIAMHSIARPSGAFPAVWAGCLFALIHGRDGLLQVGQRDLFAAALLICGVAFLFAAMRGRGSWIAVGFGVCVGAASMIKPTFGIYLLLAFAEYFALRATDARAVRRLRFAVLGWLLPVLGCLAWLTAKGSLRAFWYAVSVVGPYHVAIGHAPTDFLFRNSVSPIAWLLAVWLIVRLMLSMRPGKFDRRAGNSSNVLVERRLLLFAAALGYVCYLVQQRGYPYHRYPFQVFLLLVMALDFTEALRAGALVRCLSLAALVWASVVFAPVSVVKAARYEWRLQPFREALEADLSRVAQSKHLGSLDRQVQCLDSISGCIATLDQMRLAQSTGLMYDEFLFNPGGVLVVDDARADFSKQVESDPPLVFVVSAPLFPSGPDAYRKLDQWPEFRNWLDGHYALDVERSFSVAVRPGYRIYLRK